VEARDLARLRWRCRRGMRELDVLLMRYLDREFLHAPPAEQQAFEALLSAQDPEIVDWLGGHVPAENPHLRDVLQRLLAHARH